MDAAAAYLYYRFLSQLQYKKKSRYLRACNTSRLPRISTPVQCEGVNSARICHLHLRYEISLSERVRVTYHEMSGNSFPPATASTSAGTLHDWQRLDCRNT